MPLEIKIETKSLIDGFKKAEEAGETLADKILKVEGKAESLQGQFSILEGASRGFVTSLSSISEQAKKNKDTAEQSRKANFELAQGMVKAISTFAESEKSLGRLDQSLLNTVKSSLEGKQGIENLTNLLKLTAGDTEKAAEEFFKLAEAQNELETQKVAEETEKLANEEKNLAISIEDSIKSVASQALAIAGLTVGINELFLKIKESVNIALEFQKGMGAIATLIPGQNERVLELKDSILELSIQYGKSAKDITGGTFELISAFGDSADLAEKQKVAIESAVAAQASSKEAISLLSAVTRAYGDESLGAFKKASDLAFIASKLGQTTFPELAASIGRTTATSKTLGVTQEELFAAYASLTGVVGNTAEVSTQLAAIEASLLKPSEQMAKVLKEIGVESGKAAIEQFGLQGALIEIRKKLNNNDTAFAEAIGSIDALRSALALTGAQTQKYQDALKQMKNAQGATKEAFDAQTKGIGETAFTFERASSMVDAFQIKMGEQLLPVMKSVFDAFVDTNKPAKELIQDISSLAENTASLIKFVTIAGTLFSVNYAGSMIAAGVATGGLVTTMGALATSAIPALVATTALITTVAKTADEFHLLDDAVEEQIAKSEEGGNAIEAQLVNRSKKLKDFVQKNKIKFSDLIESGAVQAGGAEGELGAINFKALEEFAKKKGLEITFRKDNEKAIKDENDASKKSIELINSQIAAIESANNGLGKSKETRLNLRKEISSFSDSIEKGIQKLTAEKEALESGKSAAEASKVSYLELIFEKAKGNELSGKEIERLFELAKQYDLLNTSVREAEKELKEKNKREKEAADLAEKHLKAREGLTKSIQEEIARAGALSEAEGLGLDSKKNRLEIETKLKIISGELGAITEQQKETYLESARAGDLANQSLEKEIQLKKDIATDQKYIASLKESNMELQELTNGTSKYAEVKNLSKNATLEDVAAIESEIKVRNELNNLLTVQKIREEIDQIGITGESLKELEAKRLLNRDATYEQIQAVKELMGLKEEKSTAARVESLKEELSLLKLSKEERESQNKLKSAGFSFDAIKNESEILKIGDSRRVNELKIEKIQRDQVLQMLGQIETQKKLNEEMDKSPIFKPVENQIEKFQKENEKLFKAFESVVQVKAEGGIAFNVEAGTPFSEIQKRVEAIRKEAADELLVVEKIQEKRTELANLEIEKSNNLIDLSKKRAEKEAKIEEERLKNFEREAEIRKEQESLIVEKRKFEANEILKSVETQLAGVERLSGATESIGKEIEKLRNGGQENNLQQISNEINGLFASLSTADLSKQIEISETLKTKIIEKFEIEKTLQDETIQKQKEIHQGRIDALKGEAEIQKQNADKFREISRGLRESLSEIQTGEFSGLSEAEKARLSGEQFRETLTRAKGGDIGAIENLKESGSKFLETGREAFRSSPEFVSIFEEVTAGLKEIAETTEGKAVESEIKATNLSDEISFREKSIEQLSLSTDLQDRAVFQLEAIQKTIQDSMVAEQIRANESLSGVATILGTTGLTIADLALKNDFMIQALLDMGARLNSGTPIEIIELNEKNAVLMAELKKTQEKNNEIAIQMRDLQNESKQEVARLLERIEKENKAMNLQIEQMQLGLKVSGNQLAANRGQ